MDCLKGIAYTAAVAWSSTGVGQVVGFIGTPIALLVALVAKIGQAIIKCANNCCSKKDEQPTESKAARKWGKVVDSSLFAAKVMAIGAIPFVGASILVHKLFQGSSAVQPGSLADYRKKQ
jgi:hypothetical protein